MNREEMLDACREIVTKQRQSQYGKPEDSFTGIAGYWSVYLGTKVTAADVANMMVLLKVARARVNPLNTDHYIDMAGYAACAAEVVTAKDSRTDEATVPGRTSIGCKGKVDTSSGWKYCQLMNGHLGKCLYDGQRIVGDVSG
jgi:hypothetical protein